MATIASRPIIGTAASWLGLLSGAAVLIAVASTWVPSNSYTIPFVFAAVGLFWLCPAAWLLGCRLATAGNGRYLIRLFSAVDTFLLDSGSMFSTARMTMNFLFCHSAM